MASTILDTNKFILSLGNRFPFIELTFEIENKEYLPFLNVPPIRNCTKS